MLAAEGMLLIGAADRRCGKTTFATALVRREAEAGAVAGAKVTTVHEDAGPCPRGDDGCGVCASLHGPFSLTEEEGGFPGKDTTLLHEAGARPVLWLCVRPGSLREGAEALLERLPEGVPVVCESNSLRKVLEPDLFLILRRKGVTRAKASCREVEALADLVIELDGESFDGPPDAIRLTGGRWTARRPATAIVLAGGKSSRMGKDKALLPLEGRPVIERVVDQLRPHFEEILVSANDREKYAFLGLEVVEDRVPGEGPMMAVASALERSRHEVNFVVPCDVPTLPTSLLTRLLREARSGADVVVPVTPEGHYEPLVAVYRKGVAGLLSDALAAGSRRIVDVYGSCEVKTVPVRPDEALRNMNTPEEYERVARPPR